MPSCGVRLSVHLSATFVDSVETNKHIFNFFSQSGIAFSLFHTKRHGNIPTGTHMPCCMYYMLLLYIVAFCATIDGE